MKIQKKNIIPYLFSAVLFIFATYIIVGGFLKQLSLSKNGTFTEAVILDFRSGPRGSSYLDYNYFVNGIKLHGSGRHYPRSDTLSIGDTILIVFDKTNPVSSKPARDL